MAVETPTEEEAEALAGMAQLVPSPLYEMALLLPVVLESLQELPDPRQAIDISRPRTSALVS